jgi:branched-chain amino acid transport system substrate-binding protein
MQGARKTEGDAMVAAAQMALRDAAPRGLNRGRRVALAIEDESAPSWGLVSDAVIRLVLKDDVVAMLTSTSGADTHLCEQVANRIGVPVLTMSADATTTQIDIPWIFRMGASDAAEAKLIAHDIYSVRRLHNVLLITQQDHDGERGIDAMRQATSALGAMSSNEVVLDRVQADFGSVIKKIEADSPQAVVIWTSPSTATSLLHALRTAGVKTVCYLSQDASSDIHVVRKSGSISGETWAVAEDSDGTIGRENFAKRFRQAIGTAPSATASETYDAVTLTMRALQSVGANRARIRDEVANIRAYEGVSGKVSFDREGNNQAGLHLVQLN